MRFATGNEGKTLTPYQNEAGIPETVVADACNTNEKVQRYSNRGTIDEIFANGTAQLSTANNGNFATKNGTSLTAAKVSGTIVSGTIAKILQANPALTLRQIEQELQARH